MRTTEKVKKEKDEVFEGQIGFFDDENDRPITTEDCKKQQVNVVKEFLLAPVKQLDDKDQNRKREQLELALIVMRLGNELAIKFNELLTVYEKACKTTEEFEETTRAFIPLKDKVVYFTSEEYIKGINELINNDEEMQAIDKVVDDHYELFEEITSLKIEADTARGNKPEEQKKTYRTKTKAKKVLQEQQEQLALTDKDGREVVLADINFKTLAIISNAEYKSAFTPKVNDTAYIAVVDEGIAQIMQDDAYDKNHPKYESISKTLTQQAQNEKAKKLDWQLLDAVATIFYGTGRERLSRIDYMGFSVAVYINELFNIVKLDRRDLTFDKFCEKLSAFENCVGVIGHSDYSTVLRIDRYNKDTGLIVFSCPYLLSIMAKINSTRQAIEAKKRKPAPIDKDYSHLIKATAVKQKNQSAYELVRVLTIAIDERGGKPKRNDERVFYTITFRTWIDKTWGIKSKLETAKNTNRKNTILKRDFEAVYKMIDTETELKEKKRDFTYTKIIPTSSTLDTVITFSWLPK